MSLSHILLGVLAKPKSGYEIKQMFDRNLKHFWFAELSQIYPALKKLEQEGLAQATVTPSDKGPDKRVYHRTEAGRAALVDWLAEAPVQTPVRLGFLGQIFFMAEQGNADQALAFFHDLLARYMERRAALEAVQDNWRRECPTYPEGLSDEGFYMQMTLDIGLRLQKTYEQWCLTCIDRIRARGKLKSD